MEVKPIFHWKVSSCWPTNANEIDTNNIKSLQDLSDFRFDITRFQIRILGKLFCSKLKALFGHFSMTADLSLSPFITSCFSLCIQ